LVAPLAGVLGKLFASGARAGFASTANNGDFNAASLLDSNGNKAVLELNDLKALERQLLTLGPEMLREFKKQAKKLGNPAAQAVRYGFKSAGTFGPLGGPKNKDGRTGRTYDRMYTQNGRLSWTKSKGMRTAVDVNYKNRKQGKALADLQAARDGTVSIVRVRVRAPAFVIADMAGKSGKSSKPNGMLSREYTINRYGKGIRSNQTHRISASNVRNWIESLDNKGKNSSGEPSRYAYPALEKHSPKFKANTTKLLRSTINTLNRRLES